MTGPFGLPRIPDEGEFNEAWSTIGNLQQVTSTEPPSFAKEAIKASEGSPKNNTANLPIKITKVPKDSKKRVRGFFGYKKHHREVPRASSKVPRAEKSRPFADFERFEGSMGLFSGTTLEEKA